MHPRPEPFGVGAAAQRLQLAQPQDLRGVKGKGVARQLVDPGDADPVGARRERRRRARLVGGLASARRDIEHRGERGDRLPIERRIGQVARQRRQPQPEARRDRRVAAAAHRARHHHLARRKGAREIMGRHPLLPLGRGEAQHPPDTGSKPGVGALLRRPAPLVEPAQNHQIGALQPRLQQPPDEQPRMPAIGGADTLAAHQVGEHRGEIGGRDERGAVALRQRPAVEQVGQGAARMPRPRPFARQPAERVLQRAEQQRRRRRNARRERLQCGT